MSEKAYLRRIRRVDPYTPGEQPKGQTFIKLNTNENPYPPSPMAREAVQSLDFDEMRLYPDPVALDFKAAVAEVYGFSTENVFVGVGSDDVLSMIFQTFFTDTAPLFFPDITYSFYPVWAGLYGVPYKEIPLRDDFTLDPADYVGENGGILFPNPNAPTGLALPLCAIRQILAQNPESLVVVDEAYVDFGAESAVVLRQEYDNLMVVQTLSKSRSLAGLRAAYALGARRLIRALEDVKNSVNSYTMNRLTLAAAAASMRDTAYWRGTCQKIIAERERLKMRLTSLGFCCTDSRANFLFVTHPDRDAHALYLSLKGAGILVRWFDAPRIRDYLRITVGTPEQSEALCDKLAEFL